MGNVESNSSVKPERPILVASNLLLNRKNYVLLGLRTDNGMWATPGGKVDTETVVDAAKREQLEETGIILDGEPDFIGISDGYSLRTASKPMWYVCVALLWRYWRGWADIKENSHSEWKWFSLNDLPSPGAMTLGTNDILLKLLPSYLKSRQNAY